MNDYKFKDNSKQVLSALEQAIENGLIAIGMNAEGHAKEILSDVVYNKNSNPLLADKNYQLTGRLRNSITFALAGKEANIKAYSGGKDEEDGAYNGVAPKDEKGRKSVFVGTNVVYAAGIELGTHRKAGAVHFLQKSATNYKGEYKKTMEDALKNAKDG